MPRLLESSTNLIFEGHYVLFLWYRDSAMPLDRRNKWTAWQNGDSNPMAGGLNVVSKLAVYYLLIFSSIAIRDHDGSLLNKERPPGALPQIPVDEGALGYTDPVVRIPQNTRELAEVPPSGWIYEPSVPSEIDMAELLALLAANIAAISDVLAPPRDQADYREMLEKMKRYMEHINKRLKEGGVSAGLTSAIWEMLQRLREALQRLKTEGLTDPAVTQYVGTLNPEVAEAERIAKELGYEEVDDGETVTGGLFGWLSAILNAIKGFWKAVVDFFAKLLSWLNPLSDTFFLKLAFIPEVGYFETQVDALVAELSDHFGVDQYLGMLSEIKGIGGSGAPSDYTADFYFWGVGKIKGKYLEPKNFDNVRNTVHNLIRAVMMVFLILFNINQVYKLLNRGASLSNIISSAEKASNGKGGSK